MSVFYAPNKTKPPRVSTPDHLPVSPSPAGEQEKERERERERKLRYGSPASEPPKMHRGSARGMHPRELLGEERYTRAKRSPISLA
jgi:hypothetical protein